VTLRNIEEVGVSTVHESETKYTESVYCVVLNVCTDGFKMCLAYCVVCTLRN
jgi:hypothetical protein